MTYAAFDLNFNTSCISYSSCNPTSQIGTGNGIVDANLIQPGLLIVIVDYSDYAVAHSWNGINGSGYLCKLTFNATAQDISQLAFSGKLSLREWVACDHIETCIEGEIENVRWTNSSINVVNN